MAAPTWQEYYDIGKAEAIIRRPDLVFQEGDISEMYMAAAAAMADRLTGYAALSFRNTYLDGATGDALAELVDDHWNLQPIAAVKAVGQVTFNRVSAAAGAGTIALGTTVATQKDANGKEVQYVTDSAVSYGASETGAKSVNVTAKVAGTSGNVAAGKVTRIVTTLWDTTFTVTNSATIAGGADAETDEDLRERVRNLPTTLRKATLAALEYGALQVVTVKRARAVEEVGVDGLKTGIVSVYVTDADGNSNGAMTTAVQAELENWRAAGIIVNAVGGSIFTQNVAVTLTVKTGVDVNALITNIQSAVTEGIKKLKIGETLYKGYIEQLVRNVAPTDIVSVNVTVPGTDTAPATANQIIRAGTVTVS